jgi:hypothetical protein
MRRVFVAAATLISVGCTYETHVSPIAGDNVSSATGAATSGQGRFAGAVRIGQVELERLIPGMRAVYVSQEDSRRSGQIRYEIYGTAPGRHALDLRGRGVFRELMLKIGEYLNGGSYRIFNDQLCWIRLRESDERCRGVFRLPDGTYAFSTFEDSNTPAAAFVLEPSGSSGRN